MDGIPSLGMGVVFHQLGAPRSKIFSPILSCLTRSGIEASKKFEVAMVYGSVRMKKPQET
jgi:hypothetical protein